MKPLILITNDDGILSPGLIAAAEAVEAFGDFLIVAPRTQQTAMSRAYPRGEDVGLIEEFELTVKGKKVAGYGITGSPAQVVSHAVLELAPRKPALCLSGINYGENIGRTLVASGTIGAAFEADAYGIPAIAVSQEVNLDLYHATTYDTVNWDAAIHFAKYVAEKTLREGIPPNVSVINLNIPSGATTKTQIRQTVQSHQNYFVFKIPEKRDFSKAFKLKLEVLVDRETLEPASDIQAVIYDKVVSITYLTWDITVHTD